MPRKGSETSAETFRQYSDLRLSPNGHLLAAHQQNEEHDVWINDLTRGTSDRLPLDRFEDETPVWSPDGRFVAYATSRAGPTRGVYRRAVDGSGSEELVWRSAEHTHVIDWSPDGRALIIHVLHPASGSDLLLLDLTRARLGRSYRLASTNAMVGYRRTESGLRIPRTNRAARRSMSSRFPRSVRASRFRIVVARSRSGRATAARSSIAARSRALTATKLMKISCMAARIAAAF